MHVIIPPSVHIVACGGTALVERPCREAARERFWLAARPRRYALRRYSRVSALVARRSSVVLWGAVSLHFGGVLLGLWRRRSVAASRVVGSRLLGGLRSPEGWEIGRSRVHSRGGVDRLAISRTGRRR